MSSTKFVKQVLGNERSNVNVDQYLSKNELPEETVARVLLTGVLKNQFYRKADDAAKEAVPLLIERAKKDPEFLLKAACVARNSHMKGMVKVALAAISGSAKESFLTKELTRQSAVALLSTFHPGQLIQFVELCKSKQFGRGFGSRPQKWVRAAMERWSPSKLELYTLKYPTALNQLVRLVHPRYTDFRGNLVLYILDGRKKEAKGKKQRIVEKLKKEDSNQVIANAILDHEIPWDVIKGFAGLSGPIALSAMTQMGLSALLLNIRSLEQHKVFEDNAGLTALKMKMKEVQNGRSIPLDFAKPYIHTGNARIRDILLDAMADTLDVEMGVLEDLKVGVSIDISGSMAGETLQTAGLLAVPFVKAKNLWFTTFDYNLYEEGVQKARSSVWQYHSGFCPKIKGLSRKDQIKNLLSLRPCGGTNISLPVEHAIRRGHKLDLMVIVTDEQQNTGTPLMKAWRTYKQKINKNAQLWIINATNYQWHSADFGDQSVVVYQTITPALFKNLDYVGQNLTNLIRKFDLKKFVEQNSK